MLSHGARQLRTAHWLLRLSESVIAFSLKERSGGSRRRLLHIRKGDVVRAETRARLPGTPPPGHRRSRENRRKNLTLIRFDRLRVLTSELRRLLAEERDVQVRLHGGRPLEGPKLARILRWV
jgi:hypothetical protein